MSPNLVRFGPFKLERDPDRLLCGDDPVKLRPMSLQVLRYLSERPGQFVSKDELLERVWTGRVISDSGLRLCVREIRNALGDDAQAPHYLETIVGQGYRFLEGAEGRAVPPDEATPPVGREAELRQLEDCYQQVQNGNTRIVLIGGEPGIGKTTLLKSFLQRFDASKPCQLIKGQCVVHYGKGEAYGPFLDAIATYCHGPRAKEVIRMFERAAPSWLLQMPGLLDASDFERVQRQVEGMSPERMIREFCQVIAEMAENTPLLIALEDLHWADTPTIDLIAALAELSEGKVMVIGTYRPADAVLYQKFLRDTIKELRGRGQCVEILLELLSQQDVADFVAARLSGNVRNELVEAIYQRSNGNPLFMVSLVEDLIKAQVLVLQDGCWQAGDTAEKLISEVPESLKSLISRHLNALPEDRGLLLEAASVVGLEFSAAAIGGALSQDLEQVDGELEKLAADNQFIEALEVENWPDGTLTGCYEFKHPLYLEVIHDQIGDARSARLHRKVAERLEAGYVEQAVEIAPSLAMHFDRGHEPNKTIQYRRLAAEQALARHAYTTTIGQLQKALDSLEQLPDSEDRNLRELDILMMLGPTLIAVGGYTGAEVEQTFSRAENLCRYLGDATTHFATLWNLAAFHMARCELQQSRSLIEQAAEVIRAQEDDRFELMTADAFTQQCFFEGEFGAAHEQAEIVLSNYDFAQHGMLAETFSQEDPGIACAAIDSISSWVLGDFDRSRERLQTVKTLSTNVENPHSLAFGLTFSTITCQLRGDIQATLEYADKLVALCSRFNVHWLTFGLVLQGWANMRLNPQPEYLESAQAGMQYWLEADAVLAVPYLQSLVADIQAASGQLDAATALIEQSVALAEENREGWMKSELHRIHGEIRLQRGSGSEIAEKCFEQALEVARAQQANALVLRNALHLARLWLDRGEAVRAADLLTPIVTCFTRGQVSDELNQARELLAANS